MRLLILTQYFPPEVGAPQNRLFELAVRLQKMGVEVTVLTAMPNYPKMVVFPEYAGKKYFYEEMQGIKVHRASIYVTRNRSILHRLLNYFSFVFTSMWIGFRKTEKFDFIFCESPPLFLGISAYLLAKFKRARMIMNISDLWPESAEKLGLVTNKFFLGVSTWLEEFLYRKSKLVCGQTMGIVKNIQTRFPNKLVYWLPNGVDLTYYNPDLYSNEWKARSGFDNDDQLFLYGGIIGYAQGLDVILQAADLVRDLTRVKIIMLGDGPEKERLVAEAQRMNLSNIVFLDPVPKTEMPYIVAASSAAIIPLRRLELFKGAIPSKIFESLAMKKAILLGVEGEAKELFIDEGKCGMAFTPESASELAECIRYMLEHPEKSKEWGENARKYADKKFNRNEIATQFFSLLKENMN